MSELPTNDDDASDAHRRFRGFPLAFTALCTALWPSRLADSLRNVVVASVVNFRRGNRKQSSSSRRERDFRDAEKGNKVYIQLLRGSVFSQKPVGGLKRRFRFEKALGSRYLSHTPTGSESLLISQYSITQHISVTLRKVSLLFHYYYRNLRTYNKTI